jgi:hypothetical protein
MRSLALLLVLAVAPTGAAAQSSPRSLGLELGLTRDSVAAMGDRAPVALSATWWLTGDLDATARVAWGFAARTEGRGADGSFEAGLGLRCGLASWSILRPQLLANAAFVQVASWAASTPWVSDSGARLSAGMALETFLARDLSLSLAVEASQLMLFSEGGGPGLGLAMRIGAYF